MLSSEIRWDLYSHPRKDSDPLLQEICCSPNTSRRSFSHTPSHMFCCPPNIDCSTSAPIFCRIHNFECRASVGHGCRSIDLPCISDLCLEYNHKTLALFASFPFTEKTSSSSFKAFDRTSEPTNESVYPNLPAGNPISGLADHTCEWPNFQPGISGKIVQGIQISKQILGTPTASRAKIGEVAIESQADEGWDGGQGYSKMQKLGCVVVILMLVTVVMLAL